MITFDMSILQNTQVKLEHSPQSIEEYLSNLQSISTKIEAGYRQVGKDLEQVIQEKNLYLRVSIIGSCNLACKFCHNEGGPKAGLIIFRDFLRVMDRASNLGFKRIQLTGGEPLLVKEVAEYVRAAHQYFPDVGITTNGTMLPERISSLIFAGLKRIHISLQTEMLESNGSDWQLPDWLEEVIRHCEDCSITTRLNLPVPANRLDHAADFLRRTENFLFDINVFTILPAPDDPPYPRQHLMDMIARENAIRTTDPGSRGKVLVRGYRESSGIRCGDCEAREQCLEESRSLRLGVDKVIRPCLASRRWDIPLTDDLLFDELVYVATLLATDF
jgi:GTP 3',8-cyclase